MPSTQAERHAVIELLSAARLRDGIIYELGCGWGGLARELAINFPQHTVVGIELSWPAALWARLVALGVPNLKVVWGDYHRSDLNTAAAVVCYLMIGANQRLQRRLDTQLQPRTPVVSIAFQFQAKQMISKKTMRGWMPGEVYLYQW